MKNSDKLDLYMIIRNIRFRYQLDNFEGSVLKEVGGMVDQSRNEVVETLKSMFGGVWESERSLELEQELLEELNQLTVGIKAQLGEDVTEIAGVSLEKSVESHNSIMSVGGRATNVSMVSLAPEQIAAFVEQPVGGMALNEWVDRTFDYPLEQLKQDVGAGLFRGESYEKLEGRIIRTLGDAAVNTETLVRSWVQGANVEAQKRVADANADLIKGWRWDATLENGNFRNGHGTCLRCASLDADDTVYPKDGGPQIPLHANCRCVRRWVTVSYKEMGLDIDELDDAVRPYTVRGKVDPITGEIKRGKTGVGGQPLLEAGRIDGGMDAFFDKLPDNAIKNMLGPGRYELWKNGKIKLSDLATKDGRLLTINELKK